MKYLKSNTKFIKNINIDEYYKLENLPYDLEYLIIGRLAIDENFKPSYLNLPINLKIIIICNLVFFQYKPVRSNKIYKKPPDDYLLVYEKRLTEFIDGIKLPFDCKLIFRSILKSFGKVIATSFYNIYEESINKTIDFGLSKDELRLYKMLGETLEIIYQNEIFEEILEIIIKDYLKNIRIKKYYIYVY